MGSRGRGRRSVLSSLVLSLLTLFFGLGAGCAEPTAAFDPLDPTDPLDPSPSPPSGAVASDTLFVETWESGDLRQWEDIGREELVSVRTDAGFAQGGSRYLRVRIPSGEAGPWLNRFFMPGTETDEVYVRYHVRFAGDWVGGSKTFSVRGSRVDDRWSAFGIAGRCPAGTDFFRIGVITQAHGNPGATRLYVYYPDMAREPDGVTCYGRYSDGDHDAVYIPPLAMERDRWHRVEKWVRLNRPGQADGEIKLWLDGALRAHWTGLRLRDATELKLNSVQIDASLSEWSESVRRTLYYDDILVLSGLPESRR